MLTLKDLNEITRAHMLAEADRPDAPGAHAAPSDLEEPRPVSAGTPKATGPRSLLTSAVREVWPALLRTAIRCGCARTLADALIALGIIEDPKACERLAEREFNWLYCRSICIRALREGRRVMVHRARAPDGDAVRTRPFVGEHVDAAELLADLRAGSAEHGLTGIPLLDSGLTVCLD